ncbi:MAG: cell division protein ZipA [Halomonas sp.]|uniref:cell division protein ZipA n=1 Tax=Halomonas sp. TaxID=1486246 RepID=UPI003F91E902
MELREWLIILGLVLVTAIVLDGVRRYQRQRGVPRLDQMGAESTSDDPATNSGTASSADTSTEVTAKIPDTVVDWELPNGGARVVRPAQYDEMAAKPKPKLERQEHPGPSRVLSEFRQRQRTSAEDFALQGSTQRPAQGSAQGMTAEQAQPSVGESTTSASTPASAPGQASTPSPSASRDTDLDADTVAVPEKISALDDPSGRREPELTLPADDARAAAQQTDQEADERFEPLHADTQEHMAHEYNEEDYRLVDLEGMGDSFKEGSKRVGSSMHRFGTSLHRSMSERRQQKRLERKQRQAEKEEKARIRAKQQAEKQERQRKQAEEQAAKEVAHREHEAEVRQKRAASKAEHEAALSASLQAEYETLYGGVDTNPPPVSQADSFEDEAVSHPVLQKALDSAVEAGHAKDTLSGAGEVIIISVMSRDEAGFSGSTLLNLLLACGLRYSTDMGIFHRFETAAADSNLQFSMVNAVKPGTFPVPQLEDFSTPGITLLMPLPGADDTSAAFEAMVETAMVIVRHLGGELKDENQSVMTAQTVGFARQRVQEFERRYRLRRYQVN